MASENERGGSSSESTDLRGSSRAGAAGQPGDGTGARGGTAGTAEEDGALSWLREGRLLRGGSPCAPQPAVCSRGFALLSLQRKGELGQLRAGKGLPGRGMNRNEGGWAREIWGFGAAGTRGNVGFGAHSDVRGGRGDMR